MHHEILVHNDMPKIDYCVLTVAGNPTMSGGGGKKTQHPLASFFSPTTGPAPASHRPLRTPGSVDGFANLSAYKEKYRSLLKANGWGVGGRVMPKNSWSSWQEAVKSLLEILGKQRVHQMTGGSNVGGVGGTDGADRQEEGDAEEE